MNMDKMELCKKLAKLLANGDKAEYQRLYSGYMRKPTYQIAESYQRQLAISDTTDEECSKHCQL